MGVLCVVGDAGKIETSTNHGGSWTARTSGTTKTLRGVASKPDATQVVAVGDLGAVLTSTDQGTTWMVRTGPNTTDNLTAVAWNGTRWAATATAVSGSDRLAGGWTSTDGITWTGFSLAAPASGKALATGIVAFGGVFYATVHVADAGWFTGGVYTSTNGTTWTQSTGFAAAAPPTSTLGDGFYQPTAIGSNGSRLMVATQIEPAAVAFFTSSNGTSWANVGGYGAMIANGVAGSGTGWTAVGYYGDARTLSTTTDSFSGTSPASPGIPSGQLWAVIWDGTLYASAGSDGSVYTTTTGASWTAHTTNTTTAKYGITNIPNSTPDAPTLLSPAAAQPVDTDAVIPFTWKFNDPDLPGDNQSFYAIKLQQVVGGVGTGTVYWWTGSTLATTETFVSSTASAANVDLSSVAANGDTWQWAVATKDALATTASPYSAWRSFLGSAAPVVAVTAPTGTITTTSQPAYTLTFTDPEASVKEAHQVRVFTAAQYGAGGFDPATSTAVWDSGVVYTSALTGTIGVDLPDDTTYRAYARASQQGGQWSAAWAYSQFALDLTKPPAPTLEATANTTLARVELVVNGGAGGFASAAYLIEYHDGDGLWQPLFSGTVDVPAPALDGSTIVTFYDYLLRADLVRYYRARTVTSVGTATRLSSDTSGVASLALTFTQWWLKNRYTPTLNIPVEVEGPFEVGHGYRATVLEPLGSQFNVVLKDTPNGITAKLTVYTFGETERAALVAILATLDTLLLQDPFGQQWWVDVVGQISESLRKGPVQWRTWSIPLVEVAEPAGSLSYSLGGIVTAPPPPLTPAPFFFYL